MEERTIDDLKATADSRSVDERMLLAGRLKTYWSVDKITMTQPHSWEICTFQTRQWRPTLNDSEVTEVISPSSRSSCSARGLERPDRVSRVRCQRQLTLHDSPAIPPEGLARRSALPWAFADLTCQASSDSMGP